MEEIRRRLRRARARRDQAESEYREAALAALGAGMRQSDVARELGVTRAAVNKALKRSRRDSMEATP